MPADLGALIADVSAETSVLRAILDPLGQAKLARPTPTPAPAPGRGFAPTIMAAVIPRPRRAARPVQLPVSAAMTGGGNARV
jgi:hypothetical protein